MLKGLNNFVNIGQVSPIIVVVETITHNEIIGDFQKAEGKLAKRGGMLQNGSLKKRPVLPF